jgi:hypothetical protein
MAGKSVWHPRTRWCAATVLVTLATFFIAPLSARADGPLGPNPVVDSGYEAPPRVLASLLRNGDGTFTFTRSNQSLFTFDWRASSSLNPTGMAIPSPTRTVIGSSPISVTQVAER